METAGHESATRTGGPKPAGLTSMGPVSSRSEKVHILKWRPALPTGEGRSALTALLPGHHLEEVRPVLFTHIPSLVSPQLHSGCLRGSGACSISWSNLRSRKVRIQLERSMLDVLHRACPQIVTSVRARVLERKGKPQKCTAQVPC